MTAYAVERGRGVGSGQLSEIATRLAGRWKLGVYAELTRYGLLRDIAHNFAAPAAKIPLAVRLLADRDLPALFGHAGAGSDLAERLEVAWRHAFIEKGARGRPAPAISSRMSPALRPPGRRRGRARR